MKSTKSTSSAGNCSIRMKNVELYYPAAVFNSTTLKQELFSLVRRKNQNSMVKLADVHALSNFSLEVKEGERLGVIGFNGAGKSTLLKAIAGLYPIRSGSIERNGDVRALLELTLGFDIMSTGRENIMYRGLMLGCSPGEVREMEDDIIQFADIGPFIDYPISSYSSGMLVRLAFAISTTIRGEILLVDEVLSAGDVIFQAKARQRMMNVMDNAKILVLVLHDMETIKEICNRVILLDHGSIVMDGKPDDVVKYYLERA